MREFACNNRFRQAVVGAEMKVPLRDGRMVTAINFDNAATTPPLKAVMKAISQYAPWYASVHRGKGQKSIFSSDLYESSREKVKQFVGAGADDTVIFTKNTTEALNLLAYLHGQQQEFPVVLSTVMEHLANDLPWRHWCKADYVGVGSHGQLRMADLKAKLEQYNGRVKLVTVTGASNVTGYCNDIYRIARLAHRYGAKIAIDGAQLVPHAPFDMKPGCSPEHIDYVVFSAHKMYAPFGAGVLVGPKGELEQGLPLLQGGGAVDLAALNFVQWLAAPEKLEAGTPNMMGIVAMLAAMEELQNLQLQQIHEYETQLIRYTIAGLQEIPEVRLFGAGNGQEERVSLISFAVEGFYHSKIAEILSQEAGISVRSGLFCAHPYVETLLSFSEEQLAYYQEHDEAVVPGLVRISFGLYNNFREIDTFLAMMRKITRNKQKYAQYGDERDTIRDNSHRGRWC